MVDGSAIQRSNFKMQMLTLLGRFKVGAFLKCDVRISGSHLRHRGANPRLPMQVTFCTLEGLSPDRGGAVHTPIGQPAPKTCSGFSLCRAFTVLLVPIH